MIYLDACATTPLDPAVRAVMMEADAQFGNPSSPHGAGRAARAALEAARSRLGEILRLPAEGITFTASGSEAANLALKGFVLARAPRPTHLVVSAIEHDCVRHAARWLARTFDWVTLSEVAPDPRGFIQPEAVERALRPETALVALMLVNNETGAIQPVAEVARLAHRHGAACFADAVQAMGRLALDGAALECDLLSLAAHKFYGPHGVGLLWARPGLALEPLIHGGHQENGRHAGTQNLPGVIGMAKAAGLVIDSLDFTLAHLQRLATVFVSEVKKKIPALEQNSPLTDTVPGVVNLALPGVRQDDLVVGMDVEGVAISAGAACCSGVIEPSPVLRAMGLPRWRVEGAIRISFGRENTEAEAYEAARKLVMVGRRLAPLGLTEINQP